LDTTNQQKILGYFIEEAKEHLETLERGILELSSVVADSERVNEMFRAAHSIKGGAAMLGYGSIQKTAHRLEDAFKVLKENNLQIDQKLESLFLGVYDVLQDLIEQLQASMGLRDEDAEVIIQRGEPIFIELQDYLTKLLGQGLGVSPAEAAKLSRPSVYLPEQIKQLLKQMLQLFKQQETLENRQKLQQLCGQLGQLVPYEKGWQSLVKMSESAIANPQYSFLTLAPIIIQELKQGSDLMELGKGQYLVPSPGLQKLAAAKMPQILITLDPQAVANTLMKVFNKQQLSRLLQVLSVEA
jgi:chemotaxis protein histidine kinase CheA